MESTNLNLSLTQLLEPVTWNTRDISVSSVTSKLASLATRGYFVPMPVKVIEEIVARKICPSLTFYDRDDPRSVTNAFVHSPVTRDPPPVPKMTQRAEFAFRATTGSYLRPRPTPVNIELLELYARTTIRDFKTLPRPPPPFDTYLTPYAPPVEEAAFPVPALTRAKYLAEFAPALNVDMHGGVISRGIASVLPPLNHTVNIPGFNFSPVSHNVNIPGFNAGTASALTLNHAVSLAPDTSSYLQMVGSQVLCSAAHLMMHTTLKGVVFTVLEFLYRTCSPLLGGVTLSSIFQEYVWPLLEYSYTLSASLISKVRNGLRPESTEHVQARMDSLDEFSWAEAVPLGAGVASIIAALVSGNKLVASASGFKEFKKWSDLGSGLSKTKAGITTVVEFASWIMEHTRTLLMQYFPSAAVTTDRKSVV